MDLFGKKNVILLLGLLGLIAGCTKEKPDPPNPFDSIVRPPTITELSPPDSHSIVGLQQYIFANSCATPGCHDGHFEPDFRTVQSTYASLVYHPVIKNTADSLFRYRVIPGDYEHSWLHERLITDNSVLGRMPLYSAPLKSNQLQAIRKWINEGAKDMFGNSPIKPSQNFPGYWGIAAFVSPFDYRIDSIRGTEWWSPFGVPRNQNIDMWFNIWDDSVDIHQLQNCEIKLSTSINDFSNAKTYPLTYSPTPKVVPKYWDKKYDGWFWWKTTINTAQFSPNSIVFIRVYAKNPNGNIIVERPITETWYGAKYYSAFYVAP